MTHTQIKNIEQNKFINPKNYVGYTGIWVLGEGVLFTTEEQARKNYRETSTGNEMNPKLFVVNIEGTEYFIIRATNVFD